MNTRRTSDAAFGLVAWLEQTQIYLPLKAIECRFQAIGAAVDVEIDQVFHHSASRPLDVTYSFPLPSKAAFYRCEMIVNGRSIRAKVVGQEVAREIAMQKKAEGRRTALVEMERGNLFTLSLGNVQPDDVLVIRFALFEELEAWKDELALQIPFNPGVRYIPGEPLLRSNSGKGAADDTDQVPDASGSRHLASRKCTLTPRDSPLGEARWPGGGLEQCLFAHTCPGRPPRGQVIRDFPARERGRSRSWLRSTLAARCAAGSVVDCLDFGGPRICLRAGSTKSSGWGVGEPGGQWHLFPRWSFGEYGREKWTKTAEALIAFANAAAQNDRLWITFFESNYRDFADKPLERDVLLRDPNFQAIATLGPGGGTELLPALQHVVAIEQRFSTQCRSHIVLIADGQVANEETVLQAVSGCWIWATNWSSPARIMTPP
jgi:Ca-activated chloride channel family protein